MSDWRRIPESRLMQCAALNTAGERCRRRARWVGDYHGDPEIYHTRESPPVWVRVEVCDDHATHRKVKL